MTQNSNPKKTIRVLTLAIVVLGLAFVGTLTRSQFAWYWFRVDLVVLFLGFMWVIGLIGQLTTRARAAISLAALFTPLAWIAFGEALYLSWTFGLNQWPGEDHPSQGFLTYQITGLIIWIIPIALIGGLLGLVGWSLRPKISKVAPGVTNATIPK